MELIESSGGGDLLDWSHLVVGASVTASGLPQLLGGPEKQMKGQARLLCNVEPRDGIADALYELAKDQL